MKQRNQPTNHCCRNLIKSKNTWYVPILKYSGPTLKGTRVEQMGQRKINLMTMHKALYDIEKLYIFTNPSAQAGYVTRSIFKQSLTGLNSEFSFS